MQPVLESTLQKYMHYKFGCQVILVKINEDYLGRFGRLFVLNSPPILGEPVPRFWAGSSPGGGKAVWLPLP
jgi:hypothetical protein